MEFLRYTIPTNEFIELSRACTALFAAVLVLWLIRISVTRKHVAVDRFTEHSFKAFAAFAFVVMIQQYDQYGQPFLVWRLPLLLTSLLAMTIAVQRKL